MREDHVTGDRAEEAEVKNDRVQESYVKDNRTETGHVDASHVRADAKPGLSIAGGLAALAGAVALAFVFYYVVGYPANVPLALGASVLLTELVEGTVWSGRKSRAVAGRALLHGVLAAGAAWLGVIFMRAIG